MAGKTKNADPNKIVLVASADQTRTADIANRIEALGGVDVFTHTSCQASYDFIPDMLRSGQLPAVIITDSVAGEEMKGVDLVRGIKKLGPVFAQIPIYMIAADEATKRGDKIPGVNMVFGSGPDDVDKLVARIKTVLKGLHRPPK